MNVAYVSPMLGLGLGKVAPMLQSHMPHGA
jgi:hypothetical protein